MQVLYEDEVWRTAFLDDTKFDKIKQSQPNTEVIIRRGKIAKRVRIKFLEKNPEKKSRGETHTGGIPIGVGS